MGISLSRKTNGTNQMQTLKYMFHEDLALFSTKAHA
jgi:hypothetical protein